MTGEGRSCEKLPKKAIEILAGIPPQIPQKRLKNRGKCGILYSVVCSPSETAAIHPRRKDGVRARLGGEIMLYTDSKTAGLKEGFSNEEYIRLQSAKIRERIAAFGGKLYMEFGGKLFDDYHASRVLPGFKPDSKLQMLCALSADAEIVIAISAADIESNKYRGDLGIPYDREVLRLIDAFRSVGLYVGSVVLNRYAGQHAADVFKKTLEERGIRVYRHYTIANYPADVAHVVSDEGFGRNEFIETSRSLVIVTAPGPGSGKMATCLSQLYHEHKR